MTKVFKLSAIPAILAATSLTATPVLAADLPAPAAVSAVDVVSAWAPGDDVANNHRWHRYRRHRVDGGDILAGVLILGGIAAIASAAKNSQDRRYRDRDYRRPYPEQPRGDWGYQNNDARGIDRAIDTCVNEVERNARIETVDTVNRNARGWEVTGTIYNGDGWTCSIGQDGRIDAIDYGRGSDDRRYQGSYSDDRNDQGYEDRDDGDRDYSASNDKQYGDDYYAAARARSDAAPVAQSSYPGGPVDGDAVDADIEFGTGYKGKGA